APSGRLRIPACGLQRADPRHRWQRETRLRSYRAYLPGRSLAGEQERMMGAVLVIDDEPHIRELVVALLAGAGLQTVSAGEGRVELRGGSGEDDGRSTCDR